MSSSDVSSVVNFFPTAHEGFVTTVGGSGVTSGGTTVPLNSVAGLTDGDIFVGIVEPGQTNEQTFTGTVDTAGLQITGVVWTRGSNVAHAAGKTVVDYVSGTSQNMMTKGILVGHNQNGSHKYIAKRVTTTASTTSWTIDADSYDVGVQTALAGALTVNAPTGTPVQGQTLVLRIKDNATARAITWNAIFRAIGTTLPSTTVVSKTMYLGFIYNATDTKWDLLSYNQEA